MSGTAYSIDGRHFSFEAALGHVFSVGSYVAVKAPDGRTGLGQILTVTAERGGDGVRRLTGDGLLLGSGGSGFTEALVEPASPGDVAAHFASTPSTTLHVGQLRDVPDVDVRLRAGGFGRHTFMCGQSGSGKTYTLGVVLERLLLETDIRIAVVDPNSDYVRLGHLRSASDLGLDDAEHRELAARFAPVADGVTVFSGPDSELPLRSWFSGLTLQQQTMVLDLDPIDDAEQYNAFIRITRQLRSDYTVADVLNATKEGYSDDSRRLGQRIENLGAADLPIWVRDGDPAIRDLLPDDWRAVVVDVGGLASFQEGSIASAALLATLWEQRQSHAPTLIVIDEAHNVCPQNPTDSNQALATEHVIRIAAEGRKFGLYLLLSTQRPGKVHQQVLSQCDNLLLMKMNSASDIQSLCDTFSYAPSGLIEQARGFGLGEGLAVGKIAPDPLLFKSGVRFTEEGGADVSSAWTRS